MTVVDVRSYSRYSGRIRDDSETGRGERAWAGRAPGKTHPDYPLEPAPVSRSQLDRIDLGLSRCWRRQEAAHINLGGLLFP